MTVKPMIPSMGGRELGPIFNRYIKTMERGLDVVEIGAWLGAGTLELALSMCEYGHDRESALRVFDRFEADESQVVKAAGLHQYSANILVDNAGSVVKLNVGMDTLPIVKDFLHCFKFVRFYKGEIGHVQYQGNKIGVLVIDAVKRDPYFTAMMKKFEPYLADGAVVFLMDFYYHEKVKGAGTECQGVYVEKSGRYVFLEHPPNLSCAVFRYYVDEYKKLEEMVSKFRTVCEVLREIGDAHQEATLHDKMILGKLVEAINMAKRMDKALREVHGYELGPDGWWEINYDFEKDATRRMNRK